MTLIKFNNDHASISPFKTNLSEAVKIKNKKNTKKIPKTTVTETKDEIKSKAKQQPQQQTTTATYNENKKYI